MYKTLKPLIFKLQPEKAHEWTMALLTFACAIPGVGALLRSFYAVRSKELEVEVAGLTFPNPVGLAAGFDKDARWLKQMRVLGFGFVEIGTVTPLPQDGNPQPRLFRLPADKGIINRMGFNNSGMVAAAARLRRRPPGSSLAATLARTKSRPTTRPNPITSSASMRCMTTSITSWSTSVHPTRRACGNCRKRNRSSGCLKPSWPSAPSGPLHVRFFENRAGFDRRAVE